MMALKEPAQGKSLRYLLAGLADSSLDRDLAKDLEITGVNLDSRRIKPGELFLACLGSRTSGADYINHAIQAGAAAIAVESGLNYGPLDRQIPVVQIHDLQHKAGLIAARFYGEPSKALNVVGVTGTNGKTSICAYLAQALMAHQDRDIGVIGTLGYGCFGKQQAGQNTTPDPVTLQQTFAALQSQGINTALMEVSSHGLEQGRVAGVEFNIGIFTNLSVEHLDYHGDLESYWRAKQRLFHIEGLQSAVINGDDHYGRRLIEELGAGLQVISYGLGEQSVAAVVRDDHIDHITLEVTSPWGEGVLQAGVGGRFNAHNLLACLATLCLLQVPFSEAIERLSAVNGVPGRMECFGGKGAPRIIVDYAHTPDALEKVLNTLREYCTGELICVFGCGGDRDKQKRPLMGEIAEHYADRIILTNDNPRFEEPTAIIQNIIAGLKRSDNVTIKPDRAAAITSAIESAGSDDLVLVAGKGHETYQEIAGTRYPFSDRQLVRKLLERMV